METETETTREPENGAESTGDDESLGTVVEIEVLGPCKQLVKASVPADKVQECLDSNYRELTGTVQLPGFRRGRVPRRLLEKRFGEEVEADVKESLLKDSFSQVVEEHELKVLGTPRFDNIQFEGGENFQYEVEIQVHPEFELPEYKGIEVEADPLEMDESRIDEQLESLRKRHATSHAIDPVDAGVEDSFRGSYKLCDGDVDVVTRENVTFVPTSGYLDSFLIEDLAERVTNWDRTNAGTPEAERLVVDSVEVPQFFSEETLRGRELRLEFDVQETTASQLPELDDEFAAKVDHESVDAIRETLREQLVAEARSKQVADVEKAIVEKIIAAATIDLPEDLLDEQRSQAEENAAKEAEADGKSEEEIEAARKAAGDEAAEDAARSFKEFFLMLRIGEKEKIFATEDEIKERVGGMAQLYGLPERAMMQQLQESGRLEEIRSSVRSGKIRAWLRKKANVSGLDEDTPEEAPADSPDETAAEVANAEEKGAASEESVETGNDSVNESADDAGTST